MTTQSCRMSSASASALASLLLAVGPLSAARAADIPESVADLITRLHLQQASTAVREHQGWRVPRKLVILEALLGTLPPGAREQFSALVPGLQVVVAKDAADAVKQAVDADIIFGISNVGGICQPEIINNAREMRWIHSMSAGVENCMAVPAVKSRDLLVTNMRGVESVAIAEHAVALALALARGIDTFVTDRNRGVLSRQNALATGMQVLTGKTLLVVGLGGVGTEIASRANALGMKVIATRNSGRTGPQYMSYVGLPDELLTLARTADVIVNAAPLTAETTGIFNARFFAALKPGAYFINIARGGSVVTADLVNALNSQQIAGAAIDAIDAIDPDTLPPGHPLWKAPNLIISPHVASFSDLPREERWILAREQLRRYAAGEKMLSVVDLKNGY